MISVLLVDDDPSTLRGLTSHVHWERLGIGDIRLAADGEQALRMFMDKPADIVMTDIYMPNMDGLSFIRALRSREAACPIIVLSGYEEFENVRQAMNGGANHFALKPCVIEDIEELLGQLIDDIRIRERQMTFLEKYEQEWKEMLPVMRKQWLSHLISTRYRADEISREQLAMLELDMYQSMIVVSLQTIRPVYMTRMKERDWQLIKYGAANVIEELLRGSEAENNRWKAISLDYNENMFVIVFLGEGEIFPAAEAESIIKNIIKNIVLYLKLSVLAGIGTAKQGFHQLIDSYLESQQALEIGEYGEFNRLYKAEDVAAEGRFGSDGVIPPLEYLGEFYGALNRKDYRHVPELWQIIRRELEGVAPTSLQMPRHVCKSVINAFLILDKASSSKWRTALLEIEHIAQLPQLLARMDMIVGEWVEQEMTEWNSGKFHQLIQQVKEYVELHHTEEIIFSDIAKQLFVSRNYLSQLFKKVTGETFVTYLNKFRIQKAKELLATGRYMVYEVSEMVGYQNATYFSEVFRGVTGIRPSDYFKKEEMF